MSSLPFKQLIIWQKGFSLAKRAYLITSAFPDNESYGLTKQIRRCAVSIPSNIAEGSQRTSDKDFAQFIRIARGSLAELETQILLSKDFGYIPDEVFKELAKEIEELSKMTHAFLQKLIAIR